MYVCVFFLFLFSQGGQLVGLMPVLAACHLIYICSIVLHCIAILVLANKVLSLSLSISIKDRAVRFACSTGFSGMVDPVV